MKKAVWGRNSSLPIQVGDRFKKAGIRFGTVWVISRVWTTEDGLVHAQLQSQERHSETITISLITLIDRQFFSSVPIPQSMNEYPPP